MPINSTRIKLAIYSPSGILQYSHEHEWTTTNNSIDKSHQCSDKQKKPSAKEYTLNDFIYLRYLNRKQICALRSQGSGSILGVTGRGTRDTSGWLGMVCFLNSVLTHGCVLLWQFDKLHPYDLCTSLKFWGVGSGKAVGGRTSLFPSVQNTLPPSPHCRSPGLVQ